MSDILDAALSYAAEHGLRVIIDPTDHSNCPFAWCYMNPAYTGKDSDGSVSVFCHLSFIAQAAQTFDVVEVTHRDE